MKILRQATEQRIIAGPFLDDSDGNTEMTALTIQKADVHLIWASAPADVSTSNQSEDQVADTGAPHRYGGNYAIWLSAADTASAEPVRIQIHKAGCLPVVEDYRIVPAPVYDVLAAGDPWTAAALVNAPTATNTTVSSTVNPGAVVASDFTLYQYGAFVAASSGALTWTAAYNVSACTLAFIAHKVDAPNTTFHYHSGIGGNITVTGTGGTTVNIADASATNTQTAGDYHYFIWDATNKVLLATGTLTIEEADAIPT